MDSQRIKFQKLLRELFQFDCADLDFGIYRIMNQKRAMIEKFVEKDLLDAVAMELKKGSLKEQGDLAEQLATLVAKIREDIGDDAINADGKLDPKHAGIRLGKQYLEMQEKAAGAALVSELESQVFNHLWAFFSRYYDNGDFLSTRRYSRREKYAIPYNGEEVYLHWANRDQYYIKTGEYFSDYQWKADDVSILFKLVQAETEKDNVKGDIKRLFVPRLDKVSVSKKAVTIPFEYRALTEQEDISFGKKNQQDAIIAHALESLPKQKVLRQSPAALGALLAEYRKRENSESVSRLEHHLRHYTARNTRDYFIHKDLEAFLTRELDFYLKNEVLVLDDLESGGAERADGWFQLLQAIRTVGGKIITFLAQIENFQKRIFEKRKFVTETNYCFTLDRVPNTLWPKILKNKAQIEEWKKLYSIQNLKGYAIPLKQSFLETWPSLMIDTKFFADDPDFVDTLLASQRDLEESLGGLLIHSENFQALSLLLARYRNALNTIYIDPPYNTDAGPITYKNGFRHSSWLSLVANGLIVARRMTRPTAITCITIDDSEVHLLRCLSEVLLVGQGLLAAVPIKNNPAGRTATVGFSICHEYALFYGDPEAAEVNRLEHSEAQKARYKEKDEYGSFEWTNFRKHGGVNTYRTTRPRQFYPIYVSGNTIRIPTLKWDDQARKYLVIEKNSKNEEVIWPIDSSGSERIWDFVVDTARENLAHLKVKEDSEGKTAIYRKWRIHDEGLLPQTWWDKSQYSAVEYGTNLLARLFGETHTFMFPKSVCAVIDCLKVSGLRRAISGVTCDFFAGSGTTGHAVIDINREDGGRRKYILVEMGDYFDTVTAPRLQKVVFSNDWKDGKPVFPKVGKSSGISHAFKYIRLESYEDALGNIKFEGPQGELRLDDYVLRYMLDFETRESETLLNAKKLVAPFSYQLDITDGVERKMKPVDLPETFNYLLGLKVSSRQVHVRDGKHRYLVIRGMTNPHSEGGERLVVVIWRDVTSWKPSDFKADAEFVKEKKLVGGAVDVFVNADSVIPGARVLDPVFKELMFASVAA